MRSVAIPIIKEKSGRVKILNLTLYQRVVESLKTGPVYDIVIKPKEKERTDSDGMRKYFWSTVAKMISDETGHSSEAIHEALKHKFLAYKDEKTGLELVPSVFSSESTMTISEKWDYIEQCRRWAADFIGVFIPSPEQVVDQ